MNIPVIILDKHMLVAKVGEVYRVLIGLSCPYWCVAVIISSYLRDTKIRAEHIGAHEHSPSLITLIKLSIKLVFDYLSFSSMLR